MMGAGSLPATPPIKAQPSYIFQANTPEHKTGQDHDANVWCINKLYQDLDVLNSEHRQSNGLGAEHYILIRNNLPTYCYRHGKT